METMNKIEKTHQIASSNFSYEIKNQRTFFHGSFSFDFVLSKIKYKSTINTMRIISSFFNYLLGIVLLSEFLRCFAQTHKYIMFH